ncbi:aldehyde dehydrogenase family protein [Novosphingobium aerophilum]|uniref:Aldehyde dehydrogenase family protein n=1 Tax=Novosphingobium aerophilum TaxID=2839843 RepID=A0A7X1F4B8_9SPHN|nr:aldehyde dehydrogenase family protein [Novosphingobium aerophilum]MBC2650115.1 aldehyde dehydrogenase family protein [Novosphingobium aerophilum]
MIQSAYERGAQLGQFIGGAIRDGRGVPYDVIDPATEAVLATVRGASEADVAEALAGAEAGMREWRALSPQQRYRVLLRSAEELRARSAEIARTLSMEQGKTLAEALAEVEGSAETFEFFAAEVLRINGSILPARTAGAWQTVTMRPIGVAACFTPWNFPLLLSARKVAPALAAGCACVLKPAEETIGAPLAMAECLAAAGVPAGAISVLHGDAPRISAEMIAARAVGVVTFTGSTGIGRIVARTAAEALKPCVLELGGHAPVVVLDDVDVEAAATAAVLGKTRNAGQVCTSPTRFFVARPVYNDFVEAFGAKLGAVRIGRGIAEGSQMGALANARRLAAAESLVEDATARGARLVTGGTREGNQGFLFRPTLLADVPADARVLQEEPFCPIALAMPYDSVDEAVARANAVDVGLAGYVMGRDFARAQAVAQRLEVGQVAINNFAVSHVEAPFGGLKESGYGFECSSEAVRTFMSRQYIHHVAAN